MDNDSLTKSMIPDPELWRLAIRIDTDALQVVIYSTIEDNSLIFRTIPLDKEMPSRLRAIEEAVYSNPLLLADFARVYCIVATDCFMVAPTELTHDADDCLMLLRSAFPEFDGQVVCNTLGADNAVLLMGLDNELDAFLNRTFVSPRVAHHLAPLSRYFIATAGKGNNAKTLIHLRPDTVDIIVASGGNVLLANTFRYHHINDALYYIMATRRRLNLDDNTDEIHIGGDAEARKELTAVLREYVANVMPMIFPSSMYRIGKDAMKAPFDLIALPLCE